MLQTSDTGHGIPDNIPYTHQLIPVTTYMLSMQKAYRLPKKRVVALEHCWRTKKSNVALELPILIGYHGLLLKDCCQNKRLIQRGVTGLEVICKHVCAEASQPFDNRGCSMLPPGISHMLIAH